MRLNNMHFNNMRLDDMQICNLHPIITIKNKHPNMDKFQNKYRIPTARASFWDYGWTATYFVTICTCNQICYFGNIVEGEMVLSDIGKIVKKEWLKTFEMRADMNLFMGD